MAEDKTKNTQGGRSSSQSGGSRDSSNRGGSRPRRTGGRRPYRRNYRSRRRVCHFCANAEETIEWKKIDNLRRFINDGGAINPRRKSGLCAKHQRRVAVAVKRARHMALVPYTHEHVRVMSKA